MEPRADQQSGRRSILVVDGDLQIQRLLDLSLRNAGFEVKTVANAKEASAWLTKERPDLIVSETKLEGGADGFELCRQVKKRSDATGIAFVFLAERTVETNLRAVEAGADDFLAKPVYVQEVVAHTRALLQRRERDRLEARTRGDERFVGELEDLPLVDLLRAIQTNRRSGAVQIQGADGARGEVYFRDGAVVDAEVGRLSGLDAVCRLFSWTTGRFEIEWKNIRRKDAVSLESGELLLEALRRLEEWRRLLADVAPLDTIFEVDYHVLAERLAEIPDEVNAILRLFDGQRTFIHVIDDCGLSDLDALAVIGKLFREQIIRDARARHVPHETPGADIEGWIAESAGPFRAPVMRPRRELFGAPPEAERGVHGRATAPVEPLDEAGREPLVGERRERFTDRLIAEGAAPPDPAAPQEQQSAVVTEKTQMGIAPVTPPPSQPVMASEKTPMGLAPAMPPPSQPVVASEKTQMGIAPPAPAPALSTRPGFAAVTGPPLPAPRVARDVLTDVTPSPPERSQAAADGVPQPVAPQSPEPAIVVPPSAGVVPAPAAAAAVAPPPMLSLPDIALAPTEQRPVVGEIHARGASPRVTAKEEVTSKRITDLGIGPDHLVEKLDQSGRTSADAALFVASATTMQGRSAPATPPLPVTAHQATVVGEVVATRPKAEVARPAGKKIILDPDVPEDDDFGGSSRKLRVLLGVGLAMALAVGLVWVAFKKTARSKHHEETAEVQAEKAPGVAAPKPVIAPTTSAGTAGTSGAGAGRAVEGTPAVPAAARPLAHGAVARRPGGGSAHEAALAVLDERAADPKVARALPTEFPQLLSACRTAFTEKRAKDAEIACGAAKDANPESAEACALLGHALFNRKKRREALLWAERSVELDPRHADAYVIIGGVKQAADDAAGAKAAYKKYLQLAPTGQYASDLRAIVESL